VLAEVDEAGLCSRPIRLRGVRLDRLTGELTEGELLVPCKDRRFSVCPSCSRTYQDDAWQLVAAGIRGGKGVDPAVIDHPQLFVTLTAPSFGPVHRSSAPSDPTRACRPRRGGRLCPHGAPLACFACHRADDALVGEPLCLECFDYRGAVLWNAHLPRLWERTSLRLYRVVARAGGLGTSELRSTVRLSYMKVVEFQRRGLVHLHVVLRADGAEGPCEPPPLWLGTAALVAAVEKSTRSADVAVPAVAGSALRRARWGQQVDVRVLEPANADDSVAIAAYVAKYATKTTDGTPWLAHPIRSRAQLERLALRPHLVALVRTAWELGTRRELAHLRLRPYAHALGYGGQFSSKSIRFSTTFRALREARVAFARGGGEDEIQWDGGWRYVGRGYSHPEAELLAERLAQAARTVPRRVPTEFPKTSPEL
jgi:hypothetical protein